MWSILVVIVFELQVICVSAAWEYSNSTAHPRVPSYGPQPAPSYMVDNTLNYYNVAPDKGSQNGAVWEYSGSQEKFVSNLRWGKIMRGGFHNETAPILTSLNVTTMGESESSSYWLPELSPMGAQPRAGSGYKFYRNVVQDFKADNTGASDTVEAINAAVADGNRCGEKCGNTFSQGAIVYFPPGKYKICTPIVQLYYTQFIGDANNPPTIIGCNKFKGIALIDTDPYIPGGNGANWYINQNQFFRQIRNFKFDLREMPKATDDNDQPLVPTGIHWQVSQATSLQNLVFEMPDATNKDKTTAVGIFTENGSGGFVSDLTFNGGSIGWRAGSQQYTAHNLEFNNCLTAIQMVWDWGWVWQGIKISGGSIGLNISGVGGITGQGIGSISVVDSSIRDVEVGIWTNNKPTSPNIVLDNVEVSNVGRVVQVEGGNTLLNASGTVKMWTTGKVYKGKQGSEVTGAVNTPAKGSRLLSDGKLFVRPRPQYESIGSSEFSKATTDGGCKNDGTGDQKDCLNLFLQRAKAAGKIAYFPAGIYQVGGTVLIPTGSRVVGSSWSQIQGTGFYFSDTINPKVVVQVGNRGEVGTMEISDMLFTVAGNAAGAVVLEWNVAAVTQGAAAMWDSHIRVGGAKGTDLDMEHCPKRQFNERCMAASLMMHVTKQSSGYFENVWVWAADHDNDVSIYDSPDKMSSQTSIYSARGLLIESQGPSWFYGGGSEHSVFYNYLIHGAKDVYLGHLQTETPYFQPEPMAPGPFNIVKSFPGDPDFSSCKGDGACASAWGMIVSDSTSVTVHGAGLYSFFQDYYQDCLETNSCQQHILRVTGSKDVVFFNLFTVAVSTLAEGIDKTTISKDSNQRGFTTEISVWLPLDGSDNINTVFVGTQVWTATTVTCSDVSCLLVFPTSPLVSPTTISPSPYTTSFEFGGLNTVTRNSLVTVTFITTTTTTVINIVPITTKGIAYSNYNISSGQSNIDLTPSVDIPPSTLKLPDGRGGTTQRVFPLPPWPLIEDGPTEASTIPIPTGSLPSGSGTFYTGVTSKVKASGATVTTITFPGVTRPTTVTCPPDDVIVFATPSTSIYTQCFTTTTFAIAFTCPTTKVVSFLGPTTADVSVDCSVVTGFPPDSTSELPADPRTTTPTTTTPLPVWKTWPPGVITPINTNVDKPEPTLGGTKQPCKLWFFFVCVRRNDLHIGGWFWSYPPGIYPPGPPPGIRWPSGFSLTGSLPPWPPITIGPNGQLTYDPEPSSCTKSQTASICTVSTIFTVTSDSTHTSTIAVSTGKPTCETISGCSVSQSTKEIGSTTVRACTVRATGAAKVAKPSTTPTGAANNQTISGLGVAARDAHVLENEDVVIYPSDPRDKVVVEKIKEELVKASISRENFRIVQSDTLGGGYTAFIWVLSLSPDTKCEIETIDPQAEIYAYEQFNMEHLPPGQPSLKRRDHNPLVVAFRGADPNELDPPSSWGKASHINASRTQKLWKRAATSAVAGDMRWGPALVSLPPGVRWKSEGKGGFLRASNEFVYYYDSSAGSGTTVYVVGEPGGVRTTHPEWAGRTPPRAMENFAYGQKSTADNTDHPTMVAAVINGKDLGVCKLCAVVNTGYILGLTKQTAEGKNYDADPRDWVLEDLLAAWDDMHKDGRSPATSVINMSWGSSYDYWTESFLRRLYEILKLMDQAGVTMVAAAGNWANDNSQKPRPKRTEVDTYPQLFADPGNQIGHLPNLIVVGAASQYGKRGRFSQVASFVTTYAGGDELELPSGNGYASGKKGTSFAAPEVAALAAYFKGLPSKWHNELNEGSSSGPKAVKGMIAALQREIVVLGHLIPPADTRVKGMVWNGMIQDINCLLDFPQGGKDVCPTLPGKIGDCGGDQALAGAMLLESMGMPDGHNVTIAKRQSGGSCTLPGPLVGGTQISLTIGATAGPTCAGANGCGGHVCSGYWCAPTPTGLPPGYQDPKDPSSGGFSAPPTTIGAPTSSPSHVTPLTRGPVNCFKESDFPGHADIQPGDQDSYSTDFSGVFPGGLMGPNSAPITMRRTDKHGVNYDYSCSWVPGCNTTLSEQSFSVPLPKEPLLTAYLLVREDFTKCNNGGVGGTCQVGCLLYKFEGGRGGAPASPCPDFDCQQCGAPVEVPECQKCCPFLLLNNASMPVGGSE